MKQIKLSNIDTEIFRDSFKNFKRFTTSDIEFDCETLELRTNSTDFDKWHLITLASFYGGDLFRSNNEIVISEFQPSNIKFVIDYNQPNVRFTTNWKDNIEFNPAILNSADYFLTEKLYKSLSDESKLFIKEKMPFSVFEKSSLLSTKQFGYFIFCNTLVFVLTEREKAEITHLFKVNWNEI